MASRFDGSFQVFRIASAVHPVFDGGGARRFGSRWCTPGRSIIHTASTYALALLENLLHWNRTRLPPELCYVIASVPAGVDRTVLDPKTEPGWDRSDYSVGQALGDAWYDRGETAVLIVPSVLSPFERNVLINQGHLDARRIEVGSECAVAIDRRLMG